MVISNMSLFLKYFICIDAIALDYRVNLLVQRRILRRALFLSPEPDPRVLPTLPMLGHWHERDFMAAVATAQ
jgi:hypothetical protein